MMTRISASDVLWPGLRIFREWFVVNECSDIALSEVTGTPSIVLQGKFLSWTGLHRVVVEGAREQHPRSDEGDEARGHRRARCKALARVTWS